MMMVPYMFNDGLMDDLFSDAWAHDFDRAMRAAEPVSYTHLDVYKRQYLAQANTPRVAVFMPAFCISSTSFARMSGRSSHWSGL